MAESQALASFVPGLLAKRLRDGPAVVDAPWEDRWSGALLMTDVAGFSRLAEALNQRGEIGAEELAARLNACLAPIVDGIFEHGGYLVDFAGDAVIAVWPAEDGDLQLATRRAAACASSLPRSVPVSGADDPLHLRMAISAGEMVETVVGGVGGRWRYLLRGPAFDVISAALGTAERGQIRASRECAQLLGCAPQGEHGGESFLVDAVEPPTRKAMPGLESPIVAEAVAPFMPEALVDVTGQTSLEWLAEMRQVSVVFASLGELSQPGATLADYQAGAVAIQNAVAEFGGALQQLIVDDKGAVLVAAWGTRNATHEDDAARAVLAAEKLRRDLMKVGIGTRVGVTTGRACCALRGTSRRREYAMLGSVVNLAARLMGHADAVLCDAATARAASKRVAFSERAPVRVKGWDGPVAVFSPRGASSGRRSAPAKVYGRERELAHFASGLDRLAGREGSILLLRGEAGIGKSTLLAAFEAETRAREFTWLHGVGDTLGRTTPYHAWRSVVSGLLGSGPHTDAARLARALVRELGSGELVSLLNPVLPLELEPTPGSRVLTGSARAETTAQLLRSLVESAAGRRGLVLAIDDAQWLDSASWLALRRLGEQLPSLLLLVSTRPATDDAATYIEHLSSLPEASSLEVGPLELADTRAFVCEQLGADDVDGELLAALEKRSEGNPFYTGELARTLWESGAIALNDGIARLAVSAPTDALGGLPASVQGVVASRIDRLASPVQLSMKTASVIGTSFAVGLLGAVHPLGPPRTMVLDHLADLQSAGLAQPYSLDLDRSDDEDDDAEWRFRHRMIQEAAYHSLLSEQRQRLHQSVAEWLTNERGDDPAVTSLLAEHWVRAGVRDRALDALERAGNHALDAFANAEARDFFDRALELASTGPEVAPQRRGFWERRAADARLQLGHLATASQGAARGLALLDRPLPSSGVGRVLGLGAAAIRQLWFRAFGARAHQGEHLELRESVLAYSVVATAGFWANDAWAVVYGSVAAANLCERLPPSGLRARAYAGMCLVCAVVPMHKAAEAYGLRGVEMARDVDDPDALAYANLFLGLYYFGAGRIDDALALARASRAGYASLGNPRREEEAMSLVLSLHQARGEVDELISVGEALAASSGRRGDRQTKQLATGIFGIAAEWNGDLRRALALWSEFDLGAQDRLVRIAYQGAIARANLQLGNEVEARELATALVAEVGSGRDVGVNAFEGVLRATMTLCVLWKRARTAGSPEQRELGRLATAGNRAMKNMARVYPVARPAALLASASVDLALGRDAKAHRKIERATADARESGIAVLVWHAEMVESLFSKAPPGMLSSATSEEP